MSEPSNDHDITDSVFMTEQNRWKQKPREPRQSPYRISRSRWIFRRARRRKPRHGDSGTWITESSVGVVPRDSGTLVDLENEPDLIIQTKTCPREAVMVSSDRSFHPMARSQRQLKCGFYPRIPVVKVMTTH